MRKSTSLASKKAAAGSVSGASQNSAASENAAPQLPVNPPSDKAAVLGGVKACFSLADPIEVRQPGAPSQSRARPPRRPTRAHAPLTRVPHPAHPRRRWSSSFPPSPPSVPSS